MNTKFFLQITLTISLLILGTSSYAINAKKKLAVLVYTKNGKGYVHDNIAASVQCIQELGKENGFSVDVTDNPSVFNENITRIYNQRHQIGAGGSWDSCVWFVSEKRNGENKLHYYPVLAFW